MKEWTWKNWLGLGTVAFAVWLISYIVEWRARTNGTEHVGDAVLKWWGNVVMLEWVDTTLGAGLFAFAGGTFVYFAARQQRKEQLSDRFQAARELRIGLLSEVRRNLIALYEIRSRISVVTVYAGGHDTSTLLTIKEALKSLDSSIGEIGSFAPSLAHVISNVRNAVQRELDACTNLMADGGKWTRLATALQIAGDAASYFTPTKRLIDAEGNFAHAAKKTDRSKGTIAPMLHWLFEFD